MAKAWLGACLTLMASSAFAAEPAQTPAAPAPATDLSRVHQSIARGQTFLADLFDSSMELLPEFRGSKTFWLFHDNYLAAHLLEGTKPELSRRIRGTLHRFGVTNSGKIEIVFDESPQALPFRTYQLTNVSSVAGKVIKTEIVTTNLLKGWQEYADLLLFASVAERNTAPQSARLNFDRAAAMWDGTGFRDRVVVQAGQYATYKLALYLIAADRLRLTPPHRREVTERLLGLQAGEGGWRTDYNAAAPLGLANVETTCLALLALQGMERRGD
jgi:hypothetical protein